MVLPLIVLGVLLLLNGVFAMAELAMMTSRQSRLQQAAVAGNRGAAAALRLSRDPSRFLSTVQVGITLIGISAGAFGENALSGRLEAHVEEIPFLRPYADTVSLIIVVLGVTYFSLVFGELVPKRLALAFPEAIASLIARPLHALSVAASPAVKVLTWSTQLILRIFRLHKPPSDDVSEEDVRALVARAGATGVFTPLEHRILQRVTRVGDLRISELMVPRVNVVWIDETLSIEDIHVLVGTSPHSQFPVCRAEKGIDDIIGVVHVKDLISYGLLAGRDFKVADVAQRPLFVPETTTALRMLDQFQRSHGHLAIVVDEYGATQGLVTLNDIVQSLVGDISRRGEPLPASIARRDDGSWLIDGSLPLHELVLALDLPPHVQAELPAVNTIAGLVLSILGRIPSAGETARWQGLAIEVVDMDGQRIDKVLVRRDPDEPGPDAESPADAEPGPPG